MKLVSVRQMIAIEKEADASGWTYTNMMDHAGHNLAQVIAEVYGPLDERRILGLIGSGNNGGDALVALAWLARHGWTARAYLVRPRPANDPLLQRLYHAGGVVYSNGDDPGYTHLAELLERESVILDGILGTGIRLPLKPEVANILEMIQKTLALIDPPPQIVAVDCPSGVDCDLGEAAPQTLHANLTVTMAAVKIGLLKFPAFNLVGELRTVEIGLPEGGEKLAAWRSVQRCVPDQAWVRSRLPKRPLNAHKGTFGSTLVVAGCINYPGAAYLAAKAAYRIGAGLVNLAVPRSIYPILAAQLPEAIWLPLPDEDGCIAAEAAAQVNAASQGASTLLIGPGFGLHASSQAFLERLLQQGGLPPLVLDADGLKLVSRLEDWAARLPPRSVLTPHPGEMSVLTGVSKEEIAADRLAVAEHYSRAWGHVVVLKGAFSVIADPGGESAVIPVATPALARAGTGDVLAGMIAGLRTQGLEAHGAATAGAWIHAQAGLHAAQQHGGTAAVLAGDVLDCVPAILRRLA